MGLIGKTSEATRAIAPDGREALAMAWEIQRHLVISDLQLTDLFNVSPSAVKRWKRERCFPDSPTVRLIWLIHLLTFDPDLLADPTCWVLWKRARMAH